jgi:tyrosyl-tRNA synthetase
MFGKKKETKINTNPKEIEKIITRGVEEVFGKESLVEKLSSGKQLRIKLGIDPTSPNIHIGRAITLRKLRDFQNLGHQVIFLIGDFTALIGDPSDKLEKRPSLNKEKIKENFKTYTKQAEKILDMNNVEVRYNSEWLSKLSFEEIVELAETFSVSQMIARRNFKERLDRGDEVSLRELLYPLMQGYDSVALEADIEIGGFDQLFNLKAGRVIQKHFDQQEQDVLTTKMLEGTDGRKMSSSWGNIIAITDTPKDMYGKAMAINDDLIIKYFELCTDISDSELNEIKSLSESDPKSAKMRLAREIVSLYHPKGEPEKAEKNWVKTFSEKKVSEENMEKIEIKKGEKLIDILDSNEIVKSKTEARRLVEAGAVSFLDSEEKISDTDLILEKDSQIKVGKKRFLKIIVKN